MKMKLTTPDSIWQNSEVQFTRLLAEIKAVGLTPQQVDDLCDSMSLSKENITEIFDRAEERWEVIKNSQLHEE